MAHNEEQSHGQGDRTHEAAITHAGTGAQHASELALLGPVSVAGLKSGVRLSPSTQRSLGQENQESWPSSLIVTSKPAWAA